MASLSAYPAAPAVILRRLTGTVSNLGTDDPAQTKTEPDDLVELFFAAGAEERRLILTNLDVAARTAARQPPPASSEVIRRLETAALRRNAGEFSRMLERALGISRDLAERVARDHSGEPIVVAARALGMKAAVLQRILLFLNPVIGESIERVYDLARLFDKLTPEMPGQDKEIIRLCFPGLLPRVGSWISQDTEFVEFIGFVEMARLLRPDK